MTQMYQYLRNDLRALGPWNDDKARWIYDDPTGSKKRFRRTSEFSRGLHLVDQDCYMVQIFHYAYSSALRSDISSIVSAFNQKLGQVMIQGVSSHPSTLKHTTKES